jgi:hypothetical protein
MRVWKQLGTLASLLSDGRDESPGNTRFLMKLLFNNRFDAHVDIRLQDSKLNLQTFLFDPSGFVLLVL